MNIHFPDSRRMIGIVCSGINSACHSVRESLIYTFGYAYSRAGHVITCCSAQNLKENVSNGLFI